MSLYETNEIRCFSVEGGSSVDGRCVLCGTGAAWKVCCVFRLAMFVHPTHAKQRAYLLNIFLRHARFPQFILVFLVILLPETLHILLIIHALRPDPILNLSPPAIARMLLARRKRTGKHRPDRRRPRRQPGSRFRRRRQEWRRRLRQLWAAHARRSSSQGGPRSTLMPRRSGTRNPAARDGGTDVCPVYGNGTLDLDIDQSSSDAGNTAVRLLLLLALRQGRQGLDRVIQHRWDLGFEEITMRIMVV